MKKIKLTEKDLTKIINKVINEQNKPDKLKCENTIPSWESQGYQWNGVVFSKAISPAYNFYIKPEATTKSRMCDFYLSWDDGMNPIRLGGPDFCFGKAEAFEKAFKYRTTS